MQSKFFFSPSVAIADINTSTKYRKHAKVRPKAATEMHLEDADIENAKKEWKDLVFSEEE
jgi:hypothetical protein